MKWTEVYQSAENFAYIFIVMGVLNLEINCEELDSSQFLNLKPQYL